MIDVKELLYKAKWRMLRPQAFSAYKRIVANEYKSLDELAEMQEQSRRRIVKYAFENTVYYRNLYQGVGFEVGDIGRDRWFERLPILTKQDLKVHFDEILVARHRKAAKISTTGGSTGEPTRTAYDGRLPVEIYAWRQLEWFGAHPWDHLAYVWRDAAKSGVKKVVNVCLWWPTRHLKLDATCISECDIVKFLKKYSQVKPAVLYGYVGAVSQIAQYVLDYGILDKVANPNLKFVWVTSAPVSSVQREMMSRAFGVKVCDQYGSCEIRGIAQQCPACAGLHVNVDHVGVEFVDQSDIPVETGVYGRTLLTNFEDAVFPLIRYENGDRGRWLGEECVCGRTLPCIDSVKGRECESFVLPSGKTISGEYLTTVFDGNPGIVKGFRIVQHADLSITVEYIPAAGENQILKELDAFAKRFGSEVKVDFKRVDVIPHDRGKLRFVVRETK